MTVVVTREEMAAFLRREFPQTRVSVEAIEADGIVVAHDITEAELRPGGTVSGPVMMALADVALYVAVLSRIGLVPLAVTTSLNINFLRKPLADRRLIGRCRLMKLGKSLAVGEVWLYSEGQEEPVAHATGTYSIPRRPDAVVTV
ncbi:PaaI family thioesterase [Roseateles cellulosilyticus]|uniref:PaaI family thioesterase n=1 Tax=Pelomonas cellulosilytica TaxID=2906762 RepID=A0ABS8XVA9_9BURK|nr:PaaI family thioesterase [Pelomonas sp. P8]MCE4553215.1 PaaI family thioesterase [Pelomonas sp. P8]